MRKQTPIYHSRAELLHLLTVVPYLSGMASENNEATRLLGPDQDRGPLEQKIQELAHYLVMAENSESPFEACRAVEWFTKFTFRQLVRDSDYYEGLEDAGRKCREYRDRAVRTRSYANLTDLKRILWKVTSALSAYIQMLECLEKTSKKEI